MRLKKQMMLALSVSLVIGAILTGACAGEKTATPPAPTQIIKDITPQEAFTLIQKNKNNPDFVIIDVRTPQEFADGHIANAVDIDYYSVTFRNDIDKLDKNKTYLIYCRSGVRGGRTLAIMAELNFKEVYNMLGGIIAWETEQLPTTK